MSSKVKYLTLNDHISTFNKGITPKYSNSPTNTIVLNQKCIRDGRIDYSLSQFITAEQKYSDQKVVEEGDILINSTGQGTAGRSAYVGKLPPQTVVVDSHMLVVRLRDKKWAKILAYCLFKKEDLLLTLLTGSSGQGELNNEIVFNNLHFPFSVDFDLDFSTRLINVIDEKIALNNIINIELEQTARLVYDYWFTQFDFPDDNGKPYKSSGGKMIYNNKLKREIPADWVVFKLSELLTILTGKKDANHATKNGNFNFFTCGEEVLKCNTYEFDGKAILVAGNGNFNVKLYEGKFDAYQRTYVLIPTDEKYYTVVYLAIKDRIKAFTNGSRGSIIKFITKGDLEDILIPLPNGQISDIFSPLNLITKYMEKTLEDNKNLEELRDWLLPMLMTGQVSVASNE